MEHRGRPTAGWLVTDLKFPNVVIERPEDGRIITTEGWGVEKPLDIATFEARYPSHASAMQFLVVHNAEGAFYYGRKTAAAAERPIRRSVRRRRLH